MAYIYLIYSIRVRPVSRQGRRGELLLEIENRADGTRRKGRGRQRLMSRQVETLKRTISNIAGVRDVDFTGFDSATPLRQLDSVIHEPIESVVRRSHRLSTIFLDCLHDCADRIRFPVVFYLVDGIYDGTCDVVILAEMKDGPDGQPELLECRARRFIRNLLPECLDVLLSRGGAGLVLSVILSNGAIY